MPDLPNYGSLYYDPLQEYAASGKAETPFDTYLSTMTDKGFDENQIGRTIQSVQLHQLNQQMYNEDYSPIQNTWLGAEEAKNKYGVRINAEQKITDAAAQRISEIKAQRQTREDIINHANPNMIQGLAGWGAETVASMLDPISIGSMFVPVVGEVRSAMLMERFGPTIGRAITGAVEGAVGNALVEPLRYGLAKQVDDDYTVYDSFLNIAAGGIMGAGLHAGLGKIGDMLGITEWSKKLNSGEIKPETHFQMLKTAVGQALQDQRIQVSPILRATMERELPDLSAISSVRMIKSAEDSASVFQKLFDHEDFINGHYDTVKALLSDAEKQVLDATSTKDVLHGQIQLGSDINKLNATLERLQKYIEQAPPHARNTIAREMSQVSQELEQKQGTLNNLLETRKLIDSELQHAGTSIDNLTQQRSSIEAGQTDPNMVLNIEKHADEALKNIDFKSVRSEADKALLRQAVLKAQDLNKLDTVTPDELIDLATHQGSLDSKWYYAPDEAASIEANVQAAPEVYGDDEAQKSLDEVMSSIDPESIPEMEELDRNISVAQRLGEALRSAAKCVIQEIL